MSHSIIMYTSAIQVQTGVLACCPNSGPDLYHFCRPVTLCAHLITTLCIVYSRCSCYCMSWYRVSTVCILSSFEAGHIATCHSAFRMRLSLARCPILCSVTLCTHLITTLCIVYSRCSCYCMSWYRVFTVCILSSFEAGHIATCHSAFRMRLSLARCPILYPCLLYVLHVVQCVLTSTYAPVDLYHFHCAHSLTYTYICITGWLLYDTCM